jgi:hypothetical protein
MREKPTSSATPYAIAGACMAVLIVVGLIGYYLNRSASNAAPRQRIRSFDVSAEQREMHENMRAVENQLQRRKEPQGAMRPVGDLEH